VARGAIELELPEQEVVPAGDGGWTVQVRTRLPVEDWNAEISLLTGTVAADMMLRAGVGVLRTLPMPDAEAVAGLRRTAERLGIDWPHGASAAQVLADLPDDASAPVLALRRAATTLLRGAGYVAFGAGVPPPLDPGHGGIGAPYAHVTAPLRRLVDRFGTEVCLAIAAGAEPAPWLAEALPTLPELMGASDSLAGKVERACLDRTEAARLAGRVGETFAVIVLRASGPDGEPGEVYLPDPAVIAKCVGAPTAGVTVPVRLTEADPATGRVSFTAASSG
jgi:exoribonuclease R